MSKDYRNENEDNRLAKKVTKKANKKNSRRETKMNLESFKYDLDSDRAYDIIDDMED
jgi:hypothetical protein